MKRPLIISVEKIKLSIDRYRQSSEYQAKIEDARKAYERDKVWIEPLLNARK